MQCKSDRLEENRELGVDVKDGPAKREKETGSIIEEVDKGE